MEKTNWSQCLGEIKINILRILSLFYMLLVDYSLVSANLLFNTIKFKKIFVLCFQTDFNYILWKGKTHCARLMSQT